MEFQFQISYACCLWLWAEAYLFSVMSLSKWPPGSHIGFFGFQTNYILALNIKSKLHWHMTCVYGKKPIDFQQCHLQRAAWRPYWIFQYLDSVGGMVSWSLTQVCFGISISNFICMLFVPIGQSLLIFTDVAFKMVAILDFSVFGL